MLPSLRPYLRYIDLDDKFVERGFTIKVSRSSSDSETSEVFTICLANQSVQPGAAFKLVQEMDPVCASVGVALTHVMLT